MFTSEKAGVINWSWVDILITHLVFIPTVESHIFLPLFEPVSVHQVPAETARNVVSLPREQQCLEERGDKSSSVKQFH